jgi:SagB-type dehydrogenase family enzyme
VWHRRQCFDEAGRVKDPEVAGVLHQLTKHGSPILDRSRLVDFLPLDPSNRPAPFKRFPRLETRPLPAELGGTGIAATEVLSGRARLAPAQLDVTVLARLLFFSAGVTRTTVGGGTYFRAAMSAGNLHPVELYVACGDLAGVDAGVHHFAPREFGLTTLRSGDCRRALAAAAAEPAVATGPCTLVLTGIPWRTAWKYGERGYRHLYWDAGTLLANLLAVAEAHGLPARVLLGFADSEVARLVGVDEVEEFPLALVVLGPAGELAASPGPQRLEPLDVEVAPLSPRPLTFPLITETQQAGALRGEAVVAWRAAGRDGEPAGPIDVPEPAEHRSIEEVILRRGSTRAMRRAAGPAELLRWGMAVASRPVRGDLAPGGASSLEHWISVHAVTDVEPGTYRWRAGWLEAGRRGDFREATQQLCLNQPLGGDSAYTAFHCCDLDPLLDTLGSRGYRAAQLEAGVAAGRLALAAFTLGSGATGLTFFDDEVSRFFATQAACMLVTSVGVPAYRSTPGGMPRAAAELAGFDRLMERLSLQLHRSRPVRQPSSRAPKLKRQRAYLAARFGALKDVADTSAAASRSRREEVPVREAQRQSPGTRPR